jgi:hypothetical protein
MQQCSAAVDVGTEGNESADQLEHTGSLYPFIGAETSCRTSDRVANQDIRDWMCRDHQEYWQSTPGQIHAKSFLPKPSVKRTVEFLKQQIPSKTSSRPVNRTPSLKGLTGYN